MATKAELIKELKALYEWDKAERRKIDAELKATGKYRTGLDTNQQYYREHIKEFNRRFYELVQKYKDLPPDTKIFAEDFK
mgnify:CR=1 FL=1